MKKYILFLFIPFLFLTSCSQSDEPIQEEVINERTLLIYMPWSSNLTSYFYQNIKDMETCIESMGGSNDERVIVFFSTTSSEASLVEIKYENGECQKIDIKPYSYPAFTTEAGLTRILEEQLFRNNYI